MSKVSEWGARKFEQRMNDDWAYTQDRKVRECAAKSLTDGTEVRWGSATVTLVKLGSSLSTIEQNGQQMMVPTHALSAL